MSRYSALMAAEEAKRTEESAKAVKGSVERYLEAEDHMVKTQARSAAGARLGPKELEDAEKNEEYRAKQLGDTLRRFREGPV